MAIIVCDDVTEEPILEADATGSVTTEPTTVDDEVSLGKTLLAVESGFFLSDTLKPIISEVNVNLLETRPPDVADTLRADSNRYWTLDENGNMKYMNVDVGDKIVPNANTEFPAPPFWMARYTSKTKQVGTTNLGLPIIKEEYALAARDSHIPNADLWEAFVDGASYTDTNGNSFNRPSSLIPTGSTFTDHAFTMNSPFSKKELEMFANISDSVKLDVADVESDYDFFAKAYEEGIAQSDVPENALPHLYTEVQRGESEAENTIVSTTTLQGEQVEEGYFREWMNNVLSDATVMHDTAEKYENVAILDSTVDETNLLDSETQVVSAFLLLMDYANRENLFPMNVNINVDTNVNSSVMDEAESAGMVDDIVRMLIGDGDVADNSTINIDQINKQISAESDTSLQFTARLSSKMSEPIAATWAIDDHHHGDITSDGLFTPIDIETEDASAASFTVKVTAYYQSMEASTDLTITPVLVIVAADDEPKGAKVSKEDPVTVFKGGDGLGGGEVKGGFDIDGYNIENPNEDVGLGDDGFGNNGNSGIQ